jgi:protein-S-isoprenylcysteine O-methyltransferase Ste14
VHAASKVGTNLPANVLWSRVGDVALFLAWTGQGTLTATRAVRFARNGDALGAVHVSSVATILFVSAALFLVSGRSRQGASGVGPKLVALVGTWSIIALAALPMTWRPDWLLTAATAGLTAAYGFVLWALLTLRRNLSIFPEARQLVRHGPYGLVRHPLYAAHIACYVLIAMPRLGVAAVVIAVLGIAGEVMRARNEEQVLGAAFPEYAEYASATPRFVPRPTSRSVRRPMGYRGAVATGD